MTGYDIMTAHDVTNVSVSDLDSNQNHVSLFSSRTITMLSIQTTINNNETARFLQYKKAVGLMAQLLAG